MAQLQNDLNRLLRCRHLYWFRYQIVDRRGIRVRRDSGRYDASFFPYSRNEYSRS